MTVSRSTRTIQRAAIPSAGRSWPGGIPTGNFSATIPSATSWLKRAPHDLKRRVEQRDLYMLAEPTAMPRDQRGDNAVRGHKRGIARGQRHCAVDRVGRHGRQAWVVQSGGSRYNALLAGKTGAWIVGCEAGQRAEDQARMAFARRQRAKTQPLHDPRPEILDHHIGRGDQVARDRKIIGAFKVQQMLRLPRCNTAFAGCRQRGPPVGRRG